MTIEKALEMIDEYLLEPNSIHRDWIDILNMCKEALVKNEELKAEIERYKGVIKLLEKDVAEAYKDFAEELKSMLGVKNFSVIDELVKEKVGSE